MKDCSRDYDDGVFNSMVITGHVPSYVLKRKTFKMLRSNKLIPSKQGEEWSSYWWTITILKFQVISYIIHSCQERKKMFKYGSKQISARIITLSSPDGLFNYSIVNILNK